MIFQYLIPVKIKSIFQKITRNPSIRYRLFFYSVFLALFVFITFSLASYNYFTKSLVEKQVEYYKSSIKLSNEYLNDNFLNMDDCLKKINNSTVITDAVSLPFDSRNYELINRSLYNISAELSKIFILQNYIDQIFFLGSNDMSYIFKLDKQGWYLGDDFNFNDFCRQYPLLSRDSEDNTPFLYRKAPSSSVDMTDAQIVSLVDGNLTYVKKLINADKTTKGIVIITFKYELFSDLFSSFDQPANLYLLDNNRQVIWSNNGGSAALSGQFDERLMDGLPYSYETIHGIKMLKTYYHLLPYQYRMIIQIPLSEVFANNRHPNPYLYIFGFSIPCILFILFFSYYSARKIAIPLHALADTLMYNSRPMQEQPKTIGYFFLKDSSFRTRLFIHFLFTIIIPALAFTLSTANGYYHLYYDKVTSLTVNTISQVKKYVDYNFNSFNNITKELIYSNDFQDAWPGLESDRIPEPGYSVIRDMFSDFKRSRNEFYSLNLYNRKGENIYSDIYLDTAAITALDVSYKDKLDNSIGELVFLGKISNYHNRSVLVFARKAGSLKSLQFDFGYAVFFIDQSYLNSVFRIPEQEISNFILLMDGNSNVISSDETAETSVILQSEDFLSEIVKKEAGSFSLSSENRSYLVVNTVSSDFNFNIVGVIPVSQLRSILFPIFMYSVFILILYIVLLLFISTLITSSMAKPLKKLLFFIKGSSADPDINTKRKDEIAVLFQEFNKLMLENYQSKLRESDLKLLEKEAQLKALQQQINPHFLYNTLEAINWMAYKKGAEDICNMVTALGSFFRGSISKGKDQVTFREEIEHLKSYIYIQEICNHDRIEIKQQFEDSILECRTIKLILQPIVENAIKHGFENIRHKGIVTVRGFIETNRVTIEISDNGTGMSKERINELMTQLTSETGDDNSSSIGLSNVYRRIRLYFGDQAAFSIESRENIGTMVRIVLPVLTGS